MSYGRFNPGRGGHAPGHLREALYAWIEDGATAAIITIDEEPMPIQALLGALWNCSDTLPSGVRQDLAGLGITAGVRLVDHGAESDLISLHRSDLRGPNCWEAPV